MCRTIRRWRESQKSGPQSAAAAKKHCRDFQVIKRADAFLQLLLPSVYYVYSVPTERCNREKERETRRSLSYIYIYDAGYCWSIDLRIDIATEMVALCSSEVSFHLFFWTLRIAIRAHLFFSFLLLYLFPPSSLSPSSSFGNCICLLYIHLYPPTRNYFAADDVQSAPSQLYNFNRRTTMIRDDLSRQPKRGEEEVNL